MPQKLPKGRRLATRTGGWGSFMKQQATKNRPSSASAVVQAQASSVYRMVLLREEGSAWVHAEGSQQQLWCAKCWREAAGWLLMVPVVARLRSSVLADRTCLRVCGRCIGAVCNLGSSGPRPDTQGCSTGSGSNPASNQRGHRRLTAAR